MHRRSAVEFSPSRCLKSVHGYKTNRVSSLPGPQSQFMITDAASRRPGGDPTRPLAEAARRREQRRLETSPVYPVAAAKHCIDNIEEAEFVQAAKEN